MKSGMEKQSPLISVITVSYNAVSTIEKTILSVINQTYSNIEYIVIDGGSTDETVNIIKKYAGRISYWVSEPDKGIYDAMNKGIGQATGKWINFMNSGDLLYNSDVVANFVEKIIELDVDVFYGDTILKYSWGEVPRKAMPLCMINHEMIFCHQSCFVSTSLIKDKLYNTNNKICADYSFFYECYNEKKIFYYEEMFVSIYESEKGFSSENVVKTIREQAKINGNEHLLKWKYHFLIFYVRLCLHKLIEKAVPSKLLSIYRRKRYIA